MKKPNKTLNLTGLKYKKIHESPRFKLILYLHKITRCHPMNHELISPLLKEVSTFYFGVFYLLFLEEIFSFIS